MPVSRIVFLLSLLLIAVVVIIMALAIGSVHIAPAVILQSLFGNDQSMHSQIILDIRLPRVLTGFIVGGMLALAGTMMQVLLRNPLAEPFVLGISGGSAAFALFAIALGLAGLVINLAACVGACVTMLLVFVVARAGLSWNPMRVLLTGVVIAAGWGAVISFMLVITPSSRVHSMLFWLMGDLSFAQFNNWYVVGLVLIAVLAMIFSRAMNLLSHGDLQAAALGVPVQHLRLLLYFLASILTALAVMQAGNIGFIGLIIPHAIRMLVGSDHRIVIPAAVLAGGILLVIADTIARTLLAPQQLPVGVLTAFIGVPLFLLLLHATAKQQKT